MPGLPMSLFASRRPGAPANLRLAARLFVPTGARPYPGLIVGHGAGSRASRHEAFCLAARDRGFLVLGLDFRGHGDSDGTADGPLELDVAAAAGFLRAQPGIDPARICYRGSSMGGFYGLKAAEPAELAALALLCPATESTLLALLDRTDAELSPTPDTETPRTAAGSSQHAPMPGEHAPSPDRESRWDWYSMRAYLETTDSLVLASEVKCPVLLVHARGDEQVPVAHSIALAACLRTDTTLLALEGGSHTTAQHDPAVTAYTLRWLLEATKATKTAD